MHKETGWNMNLVLYENKPSITDDLISFLTM